MCLHEKVYANHILATNPPRRPWVCKKCGERGMDVVGNIDMNEYDKFKKFLSKR